MVDEVRRDVVRDLGDATRMLEDRLKLGFAPTIRGTRDAPPPPLA
jgi:hypothetical protein